MGIMGACRIQELHALNNEDIQDLGSAILVTIPNPKTKVARRFTITDKFYHICKKYAELRPAKALTSSFFLNYQKGKCTVQNIGINKFGAMGKQVANFLRLPDAENYTGHSFRRSSATLLVNAGGDLIALKRPAGWRSTTVTAGYIDNSVGYIDNSLNYMDNSEAYADNSEDYIDPEDYIEKNDEYMDDSEDYTDKVESYLDNSQSIPDNSENKPEQKVVPFVEPSTSSCIQKTNENVLQTRSTSKLTNCSDIIDFIIKYETLAVTIPKPHVYHVELNRPNNLNIIDNNMWQ